MEGTVPRRDAEEHETRRRWHVPRRARTVLEVAFLASALVYPAAWLLSRRFWLADLISHLRELGLAAALVAALVSIPRRRWLAAALLALAAVETVPLMGYSGSNPVPPDPRSTDRFRVLTANVLFENRKLDGLVELIRVERPDAVALVEFTTECGQALEAVRRDYPYRMEYPAGASGLALWFRNPPRSIDPPIVPIPRRNPFLHATFEIAGRVCHLWAVHPTSPTARCWEPGNPEVGAIAQHVRAAGGSRIVVGDLNSTDGSAHFRDFLRVTGLRDSRLGFGRQPSWPTWLPYRIAIDHAFVSDDLAVVDRRLGPRVGSDHFPLIVDFAPAVPAAAIRDTSSEDRSAQPVGAR
jgi:endonuclease/exonuclease/phosphatase (EEP) superfamily protein YafD